MFRIFTLYLKNLLKIAGPIVLGNLGFMMIGVGDIIVAGRHSTDTLAAISLATAITNCLMMFGIGILASTSAVLSNYRGEGQNVEKYIYPSVKFSFILAAITSSMILICIPFIDKIGFSETLIPIIKDYFFVTAFATFGGYLHCAVKEYLQTFEIVNFPNLLTIACIFVNIILNIIFVFGFWIIPEMGAVGLAIASLITRYFMGIVLLIYCIKILPFKKADESAIPYYKDMLKVGLPASLAIMVEFAGFNIIAVVMGRVMGLYAAAHNILTTFTSIAFMIPLAVSNALAVKVGFANGAEKYRKLKTYAWTGIIFSVGFMALSAISIGLFPRFYAGLFTTDQNLVTVCVPILYVLCFFQMFDGLQVSLAGIFKGLKNTKIVMLSNIIGYWFIAFPLGYYLAFNRGMNLMGFWIALCISSIVLCSIMLIFMLRKFKQIGNKN